MKNNYEMPKLQAFVIQFDNPTRVYFCGQLVTGKVLVTLGQAMEVRNLRLQICGLANSYCHLSRSSVNHGSNNYTASEHYFDYNTVLWDKRRGASEGENPILDAGNHEFPFQFQLPYSFEYFSCAFIYYLDIFFIVISQLIGL